MNRFQPRFAPRHENIHVPEQAHFVDLWHAVSLPHQVRVKLLHEFKRGQRLTFPTGAFGRFLPLLKHAVRVPELSISEECLTELSLPNPVEQVVARKLPVEQFHHKTGHLVEQLGVKLLLGKDLCHFRRPVRHTFFRFCDKRAFLCGRGRYLLHLVEQVSHSAQVKPEFHFGAPPPRGTASTVWCLQRPSGCL